MTQIGGLPQILEVCTSGGPWVIFNQLSQESNFSAWRVDQVSKEARISLEDLIPEASLVCSKEAFNQVCVSTSWYTINQLDTSVPTLEVLLSSVRAKVPEHAAIGISAQ